MAVPGNIMQKQAQDICFGTACAFLRFSGQGCALGGGGEFFFFFFFFFGGGSCMRAKPVLERGHDWHSKNKLGSLHGTLGPSQSYFIGCIY